MFFKQLACYVDTTELYTNIRPNVVIPAFVRALFGWTLAVSAVWPATSSAHLGTSGAACQKTQIHTSRYILYLFVVAVIIYLYDIYIYIYINIYMHCSFGLHHFDGTQVDRRNRKRVRILYSHKSPFETRSHSFFMTPTKSSSLYVCTNL